SASPVRCAATNGPTRIIRITIDRWTFVGSAGCIIARSISAADVGRERLSKRDAAHVRTYHKMMETAAWKALSGSAEKVRLCLAKFANGRSNGAIFFSDRTGAEMTGLSRNTVRKALAELADKGFTRCTEKGGFSRKVRHAASYRLTWV